MLIRWFSKIYNFFILNKEKYITVLWYHLFPAEIKWINRQLMLIIIWLPPVEACPKGGFYCLYHSLISYYHHGLYHGKLTLNASEKTGNITNHCVNCVFGLETTVRTCSFLEEHQEGRTKDLDPLTSPTANRKTTFLFLRWSGCKYEMEDENNNNRSLKY